ncbi:prepilin-type N-terminal cleavage/methylation domain-containing protein [Verrucomicrobiota bacterium sgz303538]
MQTSQRNHAFTLLEAAVVIAVLAVLASLIVLQVDRTSEDAQLTGTRALLETLREAFVGSPAGPGYIADMKHFPGFDPTALRVKDLLEGAPSFDPIAQRGWRGPYVSNVFLVRNTEPARQGRFPAANDRRSGADATFLERHFYFSDSTSPYGVPGESAVADLWGNPVVLQVPPFAEFTPTPELQFRFARLVSAGPDGVLDTPVNRLAGMTPDGKTTERGDDIVLFLNRADVYENE